MQALLAKQNQVFHVWEQYITDLSALRCLEVAAVAPSTRQAIRDGLLAPPKSTADGTTDVGGNG